MEQRKELVDLLGRKLKIDSFEFNLSGDFSGEVDSLSYTRDRISGEVLSIARLINGKWEAISYNFSLKLFVIYQLTYVGYSERDDIRKEYKYK